MKRFFSSIFFICSIATSFSQAPPGIPYQSALRNSSGGILANQTVSLRFSIHDSLANGNILYQESHASITNAQGVVSLNIGQGVPVIGTFAQIDWAKNYKFLQIEMDASGGANYVDLGTQQMMSVPFALYSNSAGELNQGGSNYKTLIYTSDGF